MTWAVDAVAHGVMETSSHVPLPSHAPCLIRLYTSDHSLVLLSGFVATKERWLSTFKDGHVMGLRLNEDDEKQPSRDETSEDTMW